MAAGIINLQKASGGITKISGKDGLTNTEVVVPESGELATKEYVDTLSTVPIGAILNAYTIFYNCIVAFGGEFNRADYPKLWAYLQANPTLVKTQAQWITELTANDGICGYFSDGDGTTTFRVPNLDKAFLRHSGRGVGSFQADAIISHSHSVNIINLNSGSNSASVIHSYSGIGFDYTGLTGESETRPKNIAVLPLIVAK